FSINNIVVAEGTNGTVQAVFTVSLQPAAASTATVNFVTLDGTALAGSDYIATNGTLTFAAGETSKALSVTLTPDPVPEPDEDFFVRLTNGVNAYVSPSLRRAVITEVRVTGISVDVG